MSFSDLFQRKAAGRNVTSEGDEEWYDNHEKLHRDGDLPAQIDSAGGKAWFQHGKLHRENDKPAIEAANGDRAWYENGELSRKTGPAITYADKTKEAEYWTQGRLMTQAERAAIDPVFKDKIAAAEGVQAAQNIHAGCPQKVKTMARISFRP